MEPAMRHVSCAEGRACITDALQLKVCDATLRAVQAAVGAGDGASDAGTFRALKEEHATDALQLKV